ncbi:MAG: hypothetical protein ACM3X6_09960 [Patescibacteria group bacterium]
MPRTILLPVDGALAGRSALPAAGMFFGEPISGRQWFGTLLAAAGIAPIGGR